MLTSRELSHSGVLTELARVFVTHEDALYLLSSVDLATEALPLERLPAFGDDPTSYWLKVVKLLEDGIVHGGLEALLDAAARLYPGNTKFAPYRRAAAAPNPPATPAPPPPSSEPTDADPSARGRAKRSRLSLVLDIPGEDSDEVLLRLIRAAKRLAKEQGGDLQIDLVTKGSKRFHVHLEVPEGSSPEAVARALQSAVPSARVYPEDHDFPDYYLDPLFLEGPDGQRFEAEHIRASTRVSDLAEGVMGEYEGGEYWPKGKGGEKPCTVDARSPDGQPRRLRNDQTLHDAGVRPHDTLHVYPERRAGGVNSLLRAESLTVVRNQILDFAKANPGFAVEANSLEIPTEYTFRFRAPSFAPGEPPRLIDEHEVLLIMPPDFPVQAPRAFWQHDIFHPNIHGETGLVCLGVLAASYRPGLDFGLVCQMLVDMAGFQNYELTEGYNLEAQRWAASDEGQRAIVAIGGRSIAELRGRTDRRARPVTLRKVTVGS